MSELFNREKLEEIVKFVRGLRGPKLASFDMLDSCKCSIGLHERKVRKDSPDFVRGLELITMDLYLQDYLFANCVYHWRRFDKRYPTKGKAGRKEFLRRARMVLSGDLTEYKAVCKMGRYL